MKRTLIPLRLALLVLAVLGATRLTHAHATAAQDEPLLDLAAMVLTPDDLEDIGLEGYGIDYGKYRTQAQIAEEYARDEGEDLDDAREIYADMGLLRSYSIRLALPIEGGTYLDYSTEGLWLNMLELESRSDAEKALSDSVENDREDGHESIDDAPTVGDESYVSRYESVDTESGEPATNLRLSFAADRFAVSVRLYDIALDDGTSRATEPDLDTLIELGERQLDRIESAEDDDLPTLGMQVLRLGDEDGSIYINGDRYASMDGMPLRRYADTDELLETRAERMDDDGMLSLYSVDQDIRSGAEYTPGEPTMSFRLHQFEDDDAAEAWVEDIAFDRLAAEDFIDEIESIDLEISAADTTVAATYTSTLDDLDVVGIVVWAQVDDQVARITFEAEDEIDLDVLVELMEAQIDCLDAPSCGAVQVPSELTDLV